MRRPKAKALWRHAIDNADYNLCAQLITAACLEELHREDLKDAEPTTKQAALMTFALNAEPARN